MALIHPKSCECTTTGLDLFAVPPTQTAVEKGLWYEHHPLATITDAGPIEFVVKSPTEYIDLTNSYLHVQAKVCKADGSDLDGDDRVAPVNLWMHTLFQEIDVSLNNVLVSTSTNCYPYRAYIESLLNYGKEAKSTQLACSMFYKKGKSQFTIPHSGITPDTGLAQRHERIEGSKVVDMVGRIHSDIFAQNRFLLPGVDLRLRLVRSKDSFSLLAGPKTEGGVVPEYKIKMINAALFIRKAKVNPAVVLGQAKALQSSTAKYPIKRVVTKVFTVPSGSVNVVQDNLYLNTLPTKLIIGIVDSAAFNGDFAKSPFEFKHYNINSMSLYIDGQQIPSKRLQPNFTEGAYARSYFTLFTASGQAWDNFGNFISYDDYKKGFALWGFDLSASLADGEVPEIVKTGSMRLEIQFATPLTQPIHLLSYGQSDSVIEVNAARQVMTDFTP